MAATLLGLTDLSTTSIRLVESWLVEFDQAWDERPAGRAGPEAPPPDGSLRLPALIEMVKIDLERQWQRGRRLGLEGLPERLPGAGQPGRPCRPT